MDFVRKVRKFAEHSTMLILPKDLVKYLNLKPNDEVIISDIDNEKYKGIIIVKKGE